MIHYHAVIRLDANVKDEHAFVHPGPTWTAELLQTAIPLAAAQSSAWFAGPVGGPVLLRFGPQTDVRIVRSDTEHAVSREAVANYMPSTSRRRSASPECRNHAFGISAR